MEHAFFGLEVFLEVVHLHDGLSVGIHDFTSAGAVSVFAHRPARTGQAAKWPGAISSMAGTSDEQESAA
jgi:hypothetical protein